MKLIENKTDLLLLIKVYSLFVFFVASLFFLSFYAFSKILVKDEIAVEENNIDAFTQFLQKEKNTGSVSEDDSPYIIYANTDPIIQKIELFLAKNKKNLTEEELQKVENLRSERITYLMAKKYNSIIKDNTQ